MASPRFIARGGSDAEYELYKALYSTGRKEPRDFVFSPPETNELSFLIFDPHVGIKIGREDTTARLLFDSMGIVAPRVEFISEGEALTDGRSALFAAIGG